MKTFLAALGVAAAGVVAVSAQGSAPTAVRYTRAQADRGSTVYQARCAECHGADVGGDGNGVTPPLYGPEFMGNWGGLPLSALVDRIRMESAQAKSAAPLPRPQQLDVLAFLLARNEVAAGQTELPADGDALGRIKLSELAASAANTQALPPAFPRQNATVRFQTDRFVVWDIVWPKGEPTPLHRHLYDQVGTYYAPGGRKVTTPDGEARMSMTEAGSLSNTRAGTTHIEEGTTDPPLRAIFIELKRVPDQTASAAAKSTIPATAKQVMDDERVTAWDFTPPSTSPFTFTAGHDTVIVWLGTGTTQYISRGTTERVDVQGPSRVILFELK